MRYSKLLATKLFTISLLILSFGGVHVNAGYPSETFDELNHKGVKGRNRSLGESSKSNQGMPLADEGEVTILVRTTTKEGKKNACKHGRDGKALVEMQSINVVAINVPEVEAEARIKELEKEDGIEGAELDFEMHALPAFRGTVTDDASRSLQSGEQVPYGITMVKAPLLISKASNMNMNMTPRKICVVDTGYDQGHLDLPNNAIAGHTVTGFSPFLLSNPDERWDVDGHNHGTHCAGSIGAIGNNNRGVVGVNPDPTNFSFHIGKGLRNAGRGSNAAILAAVDSCVAAGANVISMSLGGGGFSTAAANTYKKAYEDDDVLIIAAAGNDGTSGLSYPASYPHVMSVAAVDSNENKASFSQFNNQVEIAGPGVNVRSTVANGNYATFSGTSMATPHVAGVAALVWSYFPACTNHQIRGALIKSAKDKGDSGCDVEFGYGIVDADAAFDLLKNGGCQAGDNQSGPSVGGCSQRNNNPSPPATTPAPTNTPTPAPTRCEGKTLKLDLLTDTYPAETSWDVRNASGSVVRQGSGYITRDTMYTENYCKDFQGCATFTIRDSFGDGVCCSHGDGSYTLTLDDEVIKTGGEFASSESTEFGCPPPIPTLNPTPAPTSPPTVSPTMSPTTSPTTAPTNSPTTNPTSSPTEPPTTSPTSNPTNPPTPSPTANPTPSPTLSPTSIPTTSPTMNPTTSPTTSPPTSPPVTSPPVDGPTPSPTRSPTTSPTIAPTPTPPTNSPTAAPTSSPTTSPPPTQVDADFDAIFDENLGVPSCAEIGTSCSSGTLLVGVSDSGPELNFPNTLDGCIDGSSGAHLSDESVESIKVISTTGAGFASGSLVTIEARVHAYKNGGSDRADFYYAADANNPVWQYITTASPNNGGINTLTSSYVLPSSGAMLQAVRVKFRYSGRAEETGCVSNSGYDDIDDLAFAVEGFSSSPSPNPSPPGPPVVAVYDSVLQAPRCDSIASGCDTGSLVVGRGSMSGGTEPNIPNSIYSTCQDGNGGSYQGDESLERIRIFTDSGGNFNDNSQVTVEATVFAWSNGQSDRALFFYTSDATNPVPVWTHFGTVIPSSGGETVVSAQYTLPIGSVQAVRVAFRYNNEDSSNSCVTGSWSEVDDLVFAVDSSASASSSSFGASSLPVPEEDEVPICGEKDEPPPGNDCANCCAGQCNLDGMCSNGNHLFSN